MDEIAIPAAEAPKPVKRAPKRKKAAKPRRMAQLSAPAPKAATAKHEYAGMTARTCPTACTAEHCIISTVGTCKHPKMTSDSGCGPVTLRNRERAKKYLKHQEIEQE